LKLGLGQDAPLAQIVERSELGSDPDPLGRSGNVWFSAPGRPPRSVHDALDCRWVRDVWDGVTSMITRRFDRQYSHSNEALEEMLLERHVLDPVDGYFSPDSMHDPCAIDDAIRRHDEVRGAPAHETRHVEQKHDDKNASEENAEPPRCRRPHYKARNDRSQKEHSQHGRPKEPDPMRADVEKYLLVVF
jgi:hypothetical protein